jgi:hypothetical protein
LTSLGAVCLLAGASLAGDREAAYGILNVWTCVRWGEDNIAWVVHYPEELVDPWVRSEAERRKMRPEEIEELRKSFSDELRMGAATAVLLSVYGYGASPVSLAPIGQNVVLIDSSGRRVSPIVFEKKLDSPISGLSQGFVFFPLQEDKNFRIAVRGLIPNGETVFEFSGGAGQAIATVPPAAPAVKTSPEREVVVRIPTKRNVPPPKPVSIDEPEVGDAGEVFPPTEPAAPPPKPPQTPEEKIPPPDDKPDSPKLAPRQALEIYLKAWIDGDYDRMYTMLSAESRGRLSKELFAREATAGNFRSALRSGYKVSWVGDSARVTVARKVLFVRTLETKQINFVTEDGSARVSW